MKRVFIFRKAGLLAVVASLMGVAVLSLAQLLPLAPPPSVPGPPEFVLTGEKRLRALREFFQREKIPGPVAYHGFFPEGTNPDHEVAMYYIAQFTLQPVVLLPNDTRATWLLANFCDLAPDARALPPGYEQRENFGGGVVLLKKKEPAP